MAQLSAADGPRSPGELLERIDGDLAYTTVTTILTRLSQKGLVKRTRQGRRYAYELTVREADVVAAQIHDRLRQSGDPTGVLRSFVTELSPDEERELRKILKQVGGTR